LLGSLPPTRLQLTQPSIDPSGGTAEARDTAEEAQELRSRSTRSRRGKAVPLSEAKRVPRPLANADVDADLVAARTFHGTA
jgi:hypothetical protein